MKRIVLATAMLLGSVSIYAYGISPYLSANLGYGYIDVKTNTVNKKDMDGIAWGANAGILLWDRPKYALGLEFGYNQLADVESGNVDYMRSPRVFDILAKGVIYGDEDVDLYGKGGIGQASFSYVNQGTSNYYVRRYVPMFSLGVDYRFTDVPGLMATVEANATLATGNNNGTATPNRAPAFYWATAGLSYRF